MENKNTEIYFIPTVITIDEIIDSDIHFGQKLVKDIIKIVRDNRGNITGELLEITQLLQVGEINLVKQKLTVTKFDYITSENINLLVNKINLHFGFE